MGVCCLALSADTLVGSKHELATPLASQVVAHKVDMIKSVEGTPSVMPPQSLIFGSTVEELSDVVDRATSLSCSLGSASQVQGDRLRASVAPACLPASTPMVVCAAWHTMAASGGR